MFLILSGFLIHFSYLNQNRKLDYIKYMNRRFWRIYPPYFCAVLLFSFFFFPGYKSILIHLFLLHNLNPGHFFAINASFWSLALEFQLYLIYPVYLFLNDRIGIKTNLLFVASIAIVLIGAGFILDINSIVYKTFILQSWINWTLGAYIAENYVKQQRVYKGSWLILLLFGLFIVTLKFFVFYSKVYSFLFSIFYALLLDKILSSPWTVSNKKITASVSFIGTVSYALYLIHQPFLKNLISVFTLDTAGPLGPVLASLAAFILLTGISYVIYLTLEKPSIRFGKRIESLFLTATNKAA